MENDGNSSFTLSLRLLDKEIIGFKIEVDDFKSKWVVLSIIAVAGFSASIATFGPEIKTLFGGQ